MKRCHQNEKTKLYYVHDSVFLSFTNFIRCMWSATSKSNAAFFNSKRLKVGYWFCACEIRRLNQALHLFTAALSVMYLFYRLRTISCEALQNLFIFQKNYASFFSGNVSSFEDAGTHRLKQHLRDQRCLTIYIVTLSKLYQCWRCLIVKKRLLNTSPINLWDL